MDNITIKVDTTLLKSVIDEVTQKISNVRNAFNDVSSIVSSTSAYWESAGHDTMKNQFDIRIDDYERIFGEMMNHFINLQQIVGVYEQAETDNKEYASLLSDNVII